MTVRQHTASPQPVALDERLARPRGTIARNLGHLALRLLPWGLILLVWQLITLTGIAGGGLVPSPVQVGSTF